MHIFDQQFWRRGGFPQRMHVDARIGPDRIFSAGPRDVSDVSRSECAEGDRERREVGGARIGSCAVGVWESETGVGG